MKREERDMGHGAWGEWRVEGGGGGAIGIHTPVRPSRSFKIKSDLYNFLLVAGIWNLESGIHTPRPAANAHRNGRASARHVHGHVGARFGALFAL